ncbi:MAG: SDR family oxidoreductase [Pirellulaceae bacterium]
MQSEPTVRQLFDLTGRTALVTGASGWLGRALACALAEAECRVIVGSRDLEVATEVASSLPVVGSGSHTGVSLDHMDEDSMVSAVDQVVRLNQGPIDILVNNGLELCGQDWTNIDFDSFVRHQANNAGYFALARQVRQHAVTAGRPASIIMVGSMYGMVASYPEAYQDLTTASSVAYHALKGGTLQMVRHLAAYWAKDSVRVNALSPGAFPNTNQVSAELVGRLEQHVPLGRIGCPHELKGALLLLASDAGSYITGQNLVVDGGWTAW